MWARRYMIETGATEEDLAAVPIAQRKHAAANERALYREPLTEAGYFAAPYVAEPFRVPDCAAEVDGASAVLVTSLERAKALVSPPAVLRAAAYARGARTGYDTGDTVLWQDYTRNYTNLLADDLWGMAGLRPHEVDLAEIYDCFSSSVLYAIEGLGIAERGGAGAFIRSGATSPGGALPVNTGGGLLCEGYVHGMNTLTEAVLQVQGRAGARQVAGAKTCVVTSGALMDGLRSSSARREMTVAKPRAVQGDADSAAWWEALAAGRLELPVCSSCGRRWFPAGADMSLLRRDPSFPHCRERAR
jgi:acetyl-CoA acetyltransferase